MKKTLFLILAAAILFDLAAGAYLMHLIDAREAQGPQAKLGYSQRPPPAPDSDKRSDVHTKPRYSIY